jgi:hypothetical protein
MDPISNGRAAHSIRIKLRGHLDPGVYPCPPWQNNGCDITVWATDSNSGFIPSLSVVDPITNADQGATLSWGEADDPQASQWAFRLTTANSSSITSQANLTIPNQTHSWEIFTPTLQKSDGSYVGVSGSGGASFVSALDLSGNQLWSSSIGRGQATPQYVLADSSVVTQQYDAQGNGPFEVSYDASGNVVPNPAAADATFSWKGAYRMGSVESVEDSVIPLDLSFGAVVGGNLTGNGTAMQHHSFGLFWCGTGYLEQGLGSQCTDGIKFSYVANPADFNIGQAQDFSAAYPDWVQLIEASALKALQNAFKSYPISAKLATFHTTLFQNQVPDQEFVTYVVGTWPVPTAGYDYPLTNSARIYYFEPMGEAQRALGYPEGQGPNCGRDWCNFTPAYPPNSPQAIADFRKLVVAIGTGIGNGIAHEAGHYLHGQAPPNGSPLFPYLDCGPGAVGFLPQPTHCEADNNFVYNFWNLSGLPQDPSNTSSNGSQFFFVDVPGHPIHWGPANKCWIEKWTHSDTKDCQ